MEEQNLIPNDELMELLAEQDKALANSAHDQFDWGSGKRASFSYAPEERDTLTADYERTLGNVVVNQVVMGRVMDIVGGDVVLDINYKADGIVPLSEFRDIPNLQKGDVVEVFVEAQEGKNGQIQISRRKAKVLRAWERLLDSFANGTILTGQILAKTKGGLIVDIGGLEAFLPGSQIDIKPVIDYDAYIGKVMEFKVVKINENIKNAVISHKVLIESDLEEQRQTILATLERGQVLEGTVKNITDFGAFLDLGGVDGLLYITDISWGRLSHPTEALTLNQKLNIVVLDFDEAKKRISLGLKQLLPHPWQILDESIVEGSEIKGKVVNVEDYGAFIEVIPGVEGLVHISEVTWSSPTVNAREHFKVGQIVDAKVVGIDRTDRKMSLSIKQLMQDPWSTILERYPIGSRHLGEVKNTTAYGVFIELPDGTGGMVHISDLSWTRRITHPNEIVKPGDKFDVLILDIDTNARKVSLGHKQLEEDPWSNFESVFPIGSYQEGKVLRRTEVGGIVQLAYGLEAFCPGKQLRKEDNSSLEVDDVAMFKVTEFNADDRRITLSHSRFWEDRQRREKAEADGVAVTEREEERKTVEAVKAKIEVSTLGDIEGLSGLKLD